MFCITNALVKVQSSALTGIVQNMDWTLDWTQNWTQKIYIFPLIKTATRILISAFQHSKENLRREIRECGMI